MRTISQKVTTAVTEAGEAVTLRYSVTAKPLKCGTKGVGETLGLRVEARWTGGHSVGNIDDVTTDFAFASELLGLLADMAVTPTTLFDVIIDAI